MKKILLILICFLLVACTSNDKQNQEVEKIDWVRYDELIKLASNENDAFIRKDYLHEAEDMLIDTYSVIPLYYETSRYLLNKDIKGVYVDDISNLHYSYMYRENGDCDTPLTICISNDPTNLDPQLALTFNCGMVWTAAGSTLFIANENEEIVPELADHYEVSDDGLTYRIYLKDNLKWSDGKELTADDFVYSFSRAAKSSNGLEASELINVIKGFPNNLQVRSLDNGKIFEVELNNPCVYFISILCSTSLVPLRQDIIESTPGYMNDNNVVVNPSAWASEAPIVTSGAYYIDSWKHNESITLKKNPYYYDAQNVKTNTIQLLLNSDATIAYSAYSSGDICLLYDKIPSDILDTLFDNEEYHQHMSLGTTYIYINVNNDFFKGMSVEEAKTFRKAIGFCIDRKFITQIISIPEENIATTIIPKQAQDGTGKRFGEYDYPYEGGYFPKQVNYDEARELLKSIGYEFDDKGKLVNPINLDYTTSTGATFEAVATCLQADLAQIGINLSIKTTDSNVFSADRKSGNFDLARGSWFFDYNDPLSTFNIFTSVSSNNATQLGK